MPKRGSSADTNGAGLRKLDGWIRDLRSTDAKIKASVPELAKRVKSEIDAAIAAGQNVDGTPWAPKKDGGVALRNAAKALTSSGIGMVIQLVLTGHEVFHHFGTHKVPRRAIFPMGGLPDRLGNAIRTGLLDMGPEWMQRAGRHDKGSKGAKMKPSAGGGR